MPIPVPKSTEDIGTCIRFLRRDKPDMSSKQRVAICLDLARKHKGGLMLPQIAISKFRNMTVAEKKTNRRIDY